jgi:hypothetical protein
MSVKPYSIDHVARFLERDLREGSSDFDLNPEIRASWPARSSCARPRFWCR